MSKFERRFGKYAIRNLSLVLIICYAVGYLISFLWPDLEYYLTLNPYLILRGQVWRLVTWILMPPGSLNLFTIIMLFFYYSVGTSLEQIWGTYRYNVYIFSGLLFTIAGSFVALLIYWIIERIGGGSISPAVVMSASTLFSTYYINMSIFLAYAITFPDARVYLMFVIPMKMKWLGIAYAVLLLAEFIMGTGAPIFNVFYRIALVASLLNCILFWLRTRRKKSFSPRQMRQRQEFRAASRQSSKKVTKHKCAICGRTEDDDPTLEFRFCSKCKGNYEYCQYHLFTHEHVK